MVVTVMNDDQKYGQGYSRISACFDTITCCVVIKVIIRIFMRTDKSPLAGNLPVMAIDTWPKK